MPVPVIDKSSYMLGVLCTKALYLKKHSPTLGTEASAGDLARQANGRALGQFAQQLFPGGVNLQLQAGFDLAEGVKASQEAIAGTAPALFEATLVHDGVSAAVDVLVREGDKWTLYEIKSGTAIDESYLDDIALQYWVATNAGLAVADVRIAHVNGAYRRSGALNVSQLFTSASVLEDVRSRLGYIPGLVASFKAALAGSEPPLVDIGPHCIKNNKRCAFKSHCWQSVPQDSVLELARAQKAKWDLWEQGTLRIVDIPSDVRLSEAQQRQRQALVEDRDIIDVDELRRFLDALQYPLHFMDFETIAPPWPLFDGTAPYRAVPFQFSLHVRPERGALTLHDDFLDESGGDPRRLFLDNLLGALRPMGDILAYNLAFERGCLTDLAKQFPERATEVDVVLSRCKDLMDPFRRGWYYSPKMHGSNSIKKVLPALTDLSYDGLRVNNGDQANNVLLDLLNGRLEDVDGWREALRDYCKLDTWAMVRILDRLQELADGSHP